MHKINIILGLVLCLAFSVTASHLSDDAPPYIAVNETVKINVYDDFQNNSQVYLINDELMPLPREENNFYFFLSSDIEEDYYYELIEVSNETITKQGGSFNYLDDDFITIENTTSYYMFETECNCSTELEQATATVCAVVESENVNRNIEFVAVYKNSTNEILYSGETDLIDTDGPTTHCGNVDFNKYNTEFNMSFGFRCVDCNQNGIRLWYDTNETFLNSSRIYDSVSNTTEIITDINYEIESFIDYSNFSTSDVYENNIKFRIPYNATISLYQQNASGTSTTTQYCNEFSSIFMVNENDKDELTGLNSLTSLFNKAMNNLLFFGEHTNLKTNFVSEDVVFFNSPYEDCKGTITLYDTGNYSLFLVGSKAIIQDEDLGFMHPFSGNEQFISNIVDIEFIEKENKQISVFTDDWEISSIWVVLNIGKWILFTIVPLVLIWLIKSGVISAFLVRLVSK